MGFATLDLAVFKADQSFEGWLPVRGSNRMKNKQQFREELITLQHDLEKTDQKSNEIQRLGTDFDYITTEKEFSF